MVVEEVVVIVVGRLEVIVVGRLEVIMDILWLGGGRQPLASPGLASSRQVASGRQRSPAVA
eukprot:4257720-Prymnesium_polylepis.1